MAQTSNRGLAVTTDRLFFGYIAAVGILAGVILIVAPGTGDSWFKPYFWVLIAVALFDGAVLLLRQAGRPAAAVSIEAKLLGFVIGIVLMIAVSKFAGSPAQLF
jgi:hypothetical protein